MEIYKKFAQLLQEVPAIKKDTSNPFFKSKYADINQVLEVLKPLLCKHGFFITQSPMIVDGKSVLWTRIRYENGDVVEESSLELVCKDHNDPQKLGQAITYMRRYALVSMFGMEAYDDDGNAATIAKPKYDPKKPGGGKFPPMTNEEAQEYASKKLDGPEYDFKDF